MDWLLHSIKKYDNRVAIVYKEKSYSYSQLISQVDQYSLSLQEGVSSGEVITILSDYNFYSIALFLALAKNKNIIAPITSKVETEVNDRIESSYTDKIISITDGELQIQKKSRDNVKHELIKRLQKQKNSGLILFSSGSTGKPKAMVHDLDILIDSFHGKKFKNLSFLVFLMFDHIGGLNTLFNGLAMGATLILTENRDAENVCELIEKNKIDILPASPTFLNLIYISEAYKKYDLSSLKMITYGTEPMPESLLLRLRTIFPKAKLLQTFGTSETGIAQISSKSSTSTLIKIDDPNLEYKIVNGELWLKSKTQILGYMNASMENFTDDGWFRTGDLVAMAQDGFLKIVGRNSEIINVGGQKVLPSEIEETILKMPEIAACVVYSEKNLITGQIVVADIVLKEKKIQIENIKKDLRLFLQTSLEPYKIPVKINIKDKLSQTDTFKIRRNINKPAV